MARVIERVGVDPARIKRRRWYWDVPAVAHVREHGLDLSADVTVIVGENGSGKSTIVEALAASWATQLHAAVKHWSPLRAAEDADLSDALIIVGESPRPQGGCFLRAEAMHGLFDAIDGGRGELAGASRAFSGELNVRSHGESFLAFLESRLGERGLFVLDEPEAALSFTSCLRLLALVEAVVANGSQVVLATHSPVLAAYPGATIHEFGEDGIRPVEWADLDLVTHWRAFLDTPSMYLRHLLG